MANINVIDKKIMTMTRTNKNKTRKNNKSNNKFSKKSVLVGKKNKLDYLLYLAVKKLMKNE